MLISDGELQIPFRNDRKKSKGKNRFPLAMTNREARAEADSLCE
jgi:hypothetical protein